MPPVEEEKPESIVLKKILIEKHSHVRDRVSPKETVLDIQTVEPIEFKISLETADGVLMPEGDEQEKVALKYVILAPEEEEPEMTPIVSRKATLTGEKIEVALDHITSAKDEPPLHDEERKFVTIASEHVERHSGEEKREGAIKKVSDKNSVLHEGKILVHEKEQEIESTFVPEHIPRESYEPRDQKRLLGKERKPKISLQPEEFPIKDIPTKDKISFVKDNTEAGIAETPLLRSEGESGGFTLEKSEVPLRESMKEHDIQNKTQRMKKSGTVAEISVDKILNKEAKKTEIIKDYEKDKNLDFTSQLHSLELSEETEPPLRKDIDPEHPTEDEEIHREKACINIKPSVLKPEVVERKAREKYSAEEGEVPYEELSGQLTEKTCLSDKKIGKKIIPEKEEKTTFSTHLKKDKIRQKNAPEKLPLQKEESDTVITGEGMKDEVSIEEHEKGVKDEIVDRSESIKKVPPVQAPEIQDKKQFQEVQIIQDECKGIPALKSSKAKTEEKKLSLTVEEVKPLEKELPVTRGTLDEKNSAKHDIAKSTSVIMKKEKGKLSDKTPSRKGIPASEEVSYSTSIAKILTPKKAEGEKECQKSEPPRMIEQVGKVLSENRKLDAPGESREVLDVPAKSHAKRGEEGHCNFFHELLVLFASEEYHFPL
ncbi:PREDICTED: uncharacterized protein LOC104272481 [Apaloderma vittatum]|uniref:uncharacterized protein LOC104272481 n=1 Tax=Apaloderma vittatum TaxID=57397 RepID=UPI0005214C37|nr:PREDICTED: uncharacterized protein LOC104272481 [Apaloderma vittatum]